MDRPAQSPEPAAPVVVGVDGSEAATAAVRWASREAALRQRTLRIVHGDGTAARPGLPPPVGEALARHGQDCLDRARAAALHIDASLPVETELSGAAPARLLIDESAAAEMTVIGWTGEGSALAHLGSTVLAVASSGHGKIVVVRGAGADGRRERPVVVGIDGTAVSNAAVGAAFAEAALLRVPLVAIHTRHDLRTHWFAGMPETIEDPAIGTEMETRMTEWLAEWSPQYPGVEVTRKMYLAGPDLHLLHWSESAQLVVVGSRGRGGFRGLLLGSTSNILVQRAHCPVLVAHGA
ncbi:universal stress protein [Nocardia carnea]|uniref:Universal stress protein n=1 Tax=Nocardia carnea TaxID=37328 RepID=A0ABW7TSB2_9NOCA|nr:universal stress protein [Nocardia carnea]